MRAIFGTEHQERLIAEFFGEGYRGTFVDVGAADAHSNSRTYDLERAGWSGVLIEPRPDCAEDLRCQRRAPVSQVACSSPERAGTTMTLHLAGGYSSLNDEFVVAGLKPQGAITVAIRTLDDVLTEANITAPIDLVSIDVEGHEADVLAGFDLQRWRPRLLVIRIRAEFEAASADAKPRLQVGAARRSQWLVCPERQPDAGERDRPPAVYPQILSESADPVGA